MGFAGETWSIAEVNMYKKTRRNPAGSVSALSLRRLASVCAGILAVNVIGVAGPMAAPQPPPIHGVTGTIATEGTIQETSEAGHTILVKAANGVQRLFHLNRGSTVHSGDAAGEEALRALKKGTPVVVHYTTEGDNLTAEEIDRLGDNGLKQMQGVVTAVNRGDRTISIKLADGTRQTLRLSDRAAAEAGDDIDHAGDGTVKVIVYFKDEAGQRVAHYFKRVS
jgi:hypothetical protein